MLIPHLTKSIEHGGESIPIMLDTTSRKQKSGMSAGGFLETTNGTIDVENYEKFKEGDVFSDGETSWKIDRMWRSSTHGIMALIKQ